MNTFETFVIMDDQKQDRLSLSSALNNLGYSTKEAWNTAEAMLCLKEGEAVFVLDIVMPDEQFGNAGLVMLGRIRKANPKAFVAIYTEHLGENEQVAYELGADIVVRKDSPERDAVLLVTSLLKRKRHNGSRSGGSFKAWSVGILRSVQAHWLYDLLRDHFTRPK
jgi:CheY-like chemotaxis protein